MKSTPWGGGDSQAVKIKLRNTTSSTPSLGATDAEGWGVSSENELNSGSHYTAKGE